MGARRIECSQFKVAAGVRLECRFHGASLEGGLDCRKTFIASILPLVVLAAECAARSDGPFRPQEAKQLRVLYSQYKGE
jgi:hypothetical protein